jgi:hypothetical protein
MNALACLLKHGVSIIYNPVKTLNLFPFNGARWLARYI